MYTFIARRMVFILLAVVQFIITLQPVQARPAFNHSANWGKPRNYSVADEIVFPESEEVDEDNIEPIHEIKEVPLCARGGANFCENVENYPENRVKMIVKTHRNIFNSFDIEAPQDDEFVNRVDLADEYYICKAHQRLVFPKLGRTKHQNWQYIINEVDTPDGYIQGVMIETCKNLGGPCELMDRQPKGYVISCKQKYIYKRLLSISDQGSPAKEFFKFPSACCCAYKPQNYFLQNLAPPRKN